MWSQGDSFNVVQQVCGIMEEPQRASLASQISGTELMDAVSHTQSGAPVGVRSLGFAADAVRFALDLLSQSRAEASPTLLHHVVWIMQELDGESYDFWEKHFLPRPLN